MVLRWQAMVTPVPCRQQGWWLRQGWWWGACKATEEGRGVCTLMGTAVLWAPQSHSSITNHLSFPRTVTSKHCLWQNCKWEAKSGVNMADWKLCVGIEGRLRCFLDCGALGLAGNWSLETQRFRDLMCSTRGGKEDPPGRERTLVLSVSFEQNHSASSKKNPSHCRDPHSDGEPICCPTPHRMSPDEPQLSQNSLVY